MAITKRNNGAWLVRIFAGTENGKRKYLNKTIHGSKRDAERYEREQKTALDRGIQLENSKITLNKYLDQWLDTSAKPRLRDRTYSDYREYLKRYIRRPLGHVRLCDLTPLKIQQVYTEMTKRGLSPRTVRYAHTILSSALKQAVKWQMILSNPAAMTDIPKSQRKEMLCLNEEQTKRFLEEAEGDKWGIVFSTAIATGMRPEEYLGLRWKDVDMTRGQLTVTRALVWRRKGGGWTLEEPKTSQSRRRIPIPATLVEALRRHRRAQLEQLIQLGTAYNNHGFVFATESGAPIQPANLTRRHFKPLLRSAGISEKVRMYDLRHTCATLLLLSGENPKVVAERLGHSSVVLTLDTYSHVLPCMQQNATHTLERMLYSKTKTSEHRIRSA